MRGNSTIHIVGDQEGASRSHRQNTLVQMLRTSRFTCQKLFCHRWVAEARVFTRFFCKTGALLKNGQLNFGHILHHLHSLTRFQPTLLRASQVFRRHDWTFAYLTLVVDNVRSHTILLCYVTQAFQDWVHPSGITWCKISHEKKELSACSWVRHSLVKWLHITESWWLEASIDSCHKIFRCQPVNKYRCACYFKELPRCPFEKLFDQFSGYLP